MPKSYMIIDFVNLLGWLTKGKRVDAEIVFYLFFLFNP